MNKKLICIVSTVALSLVGTIQAQIPMPAPAPAGAPIPPGPVIGGAIPAGAVMSSTKFRNAQLASYLSQLRSIANDLEDVAEGGRTTYTYYESEDTVDPVKTVTHAFEGMDGIADEVNDGSYRSAMTELWASSLCVDSDASGYGLHDKFGAICEKISKLINRASWVDDGGVDHKSAMKAFVSDYGDEYYDDLSETADDLDNFYERVYDVYYAGSGDVGDIRSDLEDYGSEMSSFADDIQTFSDNLEVWDEL